MPRFLTVLLATCLTLSAAAAAGAQDPAEARPTTTGAAAPAPASLDLLDLAARLRAWIEPLEAQRDFSGIIAVRQGGELIAYERFGYADFESYRPFGPRDRFAVGSITRSLTAALILDLEADGLMDRNAPLSRYLPDLNGSSGVTLNEVLTDTAGLPADYPTDFSLDLLDDDAVIAWLNARGGVAPGPHDYQPSPIGFRLLAAAAERAAEARYETLIAARLLGPLGMLDSAIEFDRGNAALATGYAAGPAPTALRDPIGLPPVPGFSGLIATADDLLSWGEAVASRRVDLLEETGNMLGGYSPDLTLGRSVYTLSGNEPGFGAGLVMIPSEDMVIAFATNIESYPMLWLGQALSLLALSDDVPPGALRPDETTLVDSHFDALGGYELQGFGPVEIVRSEAEGETILELEVTGRNIRLFLTPSGADTLFLRAVNHELRYVRDSETGAVTALDVTYRGLLGDSASYRTERTTPASPEPAETLETGNAPAEQ